MVTGPLNDLRAAVDKKDSRAFVQAYDTFTAACNNCHQATNFGFNTVQTPPREKTAGQLRRWIACRALWPFP
jgi:mono/diheme cytochrome c family protein